uniref:indole-3-pyruvate monooxygenase n=1 Tax=Setaria viridis TaxID=4556 RepID=A0A4U6U9N0_SETVI|nr:hypothetical protein SEVIR_5G042201v2 [Setaria viridis]
MHASEYRSAEELGLEGKAVLVVGSVNSGMDIALDLAEAGAVTSIVVRGEVHLLTRERVNVGVSLRSAQVPADLDDRHADATSKLPCVWGHVQARPPEASHGALREEEEDQCLGGHRPRHLPEDQERPNSGHFTRFLSLDSCKLLSL